MAPTGSGRRRKRPAPRRKALRASLLTLLVVGGAVAANHFGLISVVGRGGEQVSAASGATSAEQVSVTPSTSAAVPTPSPSPTPVVDLDALLTEAVADLVKTHGASLSVAVLDLETGFDAVYTSDDQDTGTFDTASIVKVDVLAALLLQAQDAGRRLTTQERAYASAMIRNSDNASTTALWDVIGGADGLDAANERLGLTGTAAGQGGEWGLTQTTTADQLTLLKAVFAEAPATDTGRTDKTAAVEDVEATTAVVAAATAAAEEPALSVASRAYIQELMGSVAVDQVWGVSAAGTDVALKNGWLPRTATGLWDINSIGLVTSGGHDLLLAVLSDGNTSMEEGISLVEGAAKAAADVIGEQAAA